MPFVLLPADAHFVVYGFLCWGEQVRLCRAARRGWPGCMEVLRRRLEEPSTAADLCRTARADCAFPDGAWDVLAASGAVVTGGLCLRVLAGGEWPLADIDADVFVVAGGRKAEAVRGALARGATDGPAADTSAHGMGASFLAGAACADDGAYGFYNGMGKCCEAKFFPGSRRLLRTVQTFRHPGTENSPGSTQMLHMRAAVARHAAAVAGLDPRSVACAVRSTFDFALAGLLVVGRRGPEHEDAEAAAEEWPAALAWAGGAEAVAEHLVGMRLSTPAVRPAAIGVACSHWTPPARVDKLCARGWTVDPHPAAWVAELLACSTALLCVFLGRSQANDDPPPKRARRCVAKFIGPSRQDAREALLAEMRALLDRRPPELERAVSPSLFTQTPECRALRRLIDACEVELVRLRQ